MGQREEKEPCISWGRHMEDLLLIKKEKAAELLMSRQLFGDLSALPRLPGFQLQRPTSLLSPVLQQELLQDRAARGQITSILTE